jgi:hypothetical protein
MRGQLAPGAAVYRDQPDAVIAAWLRGSLERGEVRFLAAAQRDMAIIEPGRRSRRPPASRAGPA